MRTVTIHATGEVRSNDSIEAEVDVRLSDGVMLTFTTASHELPVEWPKDCNGAYRELERFPVRIEIPAGIEIS